MKLFVFKKFVQLSNDRVAQNEPSVNNYSMQGIDNGYVLHNIGNIKDVGKFEHKKSSYSLTGSPNELVTILGYEASNKNSNNSIPNSSKNVNVESVSANSNSKEKFSFAGERVKTANVR